jgi:hypothetical protein
MKSVLIIAVLVFVLILGGGIAGIALNYDRPDTVRDWVIIVFFSIGILTGFVMLIASIAVAVAAVALISALRSLVTEKVVPLADEARLTVENIRGTSEFMSEKAVKPVVKVYSFMAGVKKAAGVVTGLGGKDAA